MNSQDVDLESSFKKIIIEISSKIGARPPCSESEKECATFYKEKLSESCDEVLIETFSARPGAYKGVFRLPILIYFIALILYWYYPIYSIIAATISFLIMFLGMSMARETIDKMYSKKESQNVLGKIKPTNESKQIVIIGSHIDSNWEFPLIRVLGYGFAIFIALNLILNAILIIMLIIRIIFLILQISQIIFFMELTIFSIFLGAIPIAVIHLLFMISNKPIIGANDNLSAMAICNELARYFKRNALNNVELWIAAFGCEEIGSKGSKAFVKKNYDDLKDSKTIILDMVGNETNFLTIGKSEIFGLVKMDEQMIEVIQNSAKSLMIKYNIRPLMAFTDSLSFRRKGLAATSIVSFPDSSKDLYYHTREDTAEKVKYSNLVNTFKICVEVVNQIDMELGKKI